MKKNKCADSAHGLLLGYFYRGLLAHERKEVENHATTCRSMCYQVNKLAEEARLWRKNKTVGKLTGRLALAHFIEWGTQAEDG